MSEFNFKSSPCTSIEQSERLLVLGLKKETADCYWFYCDIAKEWKCTILSSTQVFKDYPTTVIPAWSLGRLIEMLPGLIYPKEELPSFSGYAYLNLTNIVVWYNYTDYDMEDRTLISWRGNGVFSAVVDAVEWLIKEGYFNKEYLV